MQQKKLQLKDLMWMKKITVNPYGVEKVNKNMFKNIKKDLNFNSNDKIVCVLEETKSKGVEDFCKVADYFSREKY